MTRTVGSVTTVFVNDGNEVLAEYDNGTLARTYILGPSVDQPIAMRVGSTTYYYSRQANSSIHAVTSDAGVVVERYEYDPYGFRTIRAPDGSVRQASAIGNAYGFTGRYHDAAIGIIDYRDRQFSPDLGRFLTRDNSYEDGLSLYRSNFTPNGTDPTGHLGWSDLNPVNAVKDLGHAAEDVGGAVVDAGKATVNAIGDASKATVNALGDAANAAGNAVTTVAGAAGHAVNAAVGALGDATNSVLGAIKYAGTELLSGAEYLGNEIWLGAKYVGSETWKGAVAIAHGAWRLGGEFVDDVWQSAKTLALAYWDVVVTDLVCAWDIVQFYGLLFTGHPLDALKKLTAGVGNLAISVFEAGLIYGSVLGGWANPIPLDFTSVLGLGFGLVGWARGGDAPEIHWSNGGFVFEFPNSKNPFPDNITIGRTILFKGSPDAETRAHELGHVGQFGLLGQTYLPLHLISQGISTIASGDNLIHAKDPHSYDRYNLLEKGPHSPEHTPWPNIPRIPW